MKRSAWTIGLALVAACGVAYATGGGRGKGGCRQPGRRCIPTTKASPQYAFELLWGGTDAGLVGTGNQVLTQAGAAPVSVARSSPTLCGDTSGGFSNYLASNTTCTELHGLAVRPSTTNLVIRSQDFTQWTLDGMTRALTGDMCPDGQPAYGFFDTAANQAHRIFFNIGANNQGAGSYALSLYAKPVVSGPVNNAVWDVQPWIGLNTEQTTFDLDAGIEPLVATGPVLGSATNAGFNMTPIGNGFTRLYFTAVDSTSMGSFFQIHFGRDYNGVQGTYIGWDGGVELCDPMISYTQDFRPYVINDAGTTTNRAGDKYVYSNPLDGGLMVLAATPLPDNFIYDNWITRGILSGGVDAGANPDPNTWSLYISDGGQLTLQVSDVNSAVKTFTSNTVIWAGWRFVRVVDNLGAVTMQMSEWLDGGLVSLGVTASGSGNGYVSIQPSVLYVGSQGASNNQFGGTLEDICADSSADGCAYQWSRRANHPPWSNKASLVAFGDSFTHNSTGQAVNTNYWPNMLGLDLPTWTVTNNAHEGWAIGDIQKGYYGSGWNTNPPHVLCDEEGVNDAHIATTSATHQFFEKLFFDTVAAYGSIPCVIRQSPWAYEPAVWTSGQQAVYDADQVWVQNQAASHGYYYLDEYGNDGGLVDAGATPYQVLLCQYDADTDFVSSVVCPDGSGGTQQPNFAHLNDAGQGVVERNVRRILGL